METEQQYVIDAGYYFCDDESTREEDAQFNRYNRLNEALGELLGRGDVYLTHYECQISEPTRFSAPRSLTQNYIVGSSTCGIDNFHTEIRVNRADSGMDHHVRVILSGQQAGSMASDLENMLNQ